MRSLRHATLSLGCVALCALSQFLHPAAAAAHALPRQDARATELVFDTALQPGGQDDAQLLAVCVANVGRRRIDGVIISAEVLDAGGAAPAEFLALASASPGMLMAQYADVRVDSLGAGEMKQIDLLLRAAAPITEARLRVDVRGAHRLRGAVRLDCAPRGITAPAPVAALPVRMQSGGRPLALHDALVRLRQDGALPSTDDGAPLRAPVALAALFALMAGCVLVGLLSLGALALYRSTHAGR